MVLPMLAAGDWDGDAVFAAFRLIPVDAYGGVGAPPGKGELNNMFLPLASPCIAGLSVTASTVKFEFLLASGFLLAPVLTPRMGLLTGRGALVRESWRF